MSRSEQETQILFDEWSATYQEQVFDQEPGPLLGYRNTLDIAARMIAIDDGARVLDVGIGAGALAERYEAQGASISGVDLSSKMIEVCRSEHPDYDLHVGSFERLPMDDATFGAVITSFAYHENSMQQRARALSEMMRVCQDGGAVMIADIIFASARAMNQASIVLADEWDYSEKYALIDELDTQLREAGAVNLRWTQTSPYHWIVVARKPATIVSSNTMVF